MLRRCVCVLPVGLSHLPPGFGHLACHILLLRSLLALRMRQTSPKCSAVVWSVPLLRVSSLARGDTQLSDHSQFKVIVSMLRLQDAVHVMRSRAAVSLPQGCRDARAYCLEHCREACWRLQSSRDVQCVGCLQDCREHCRLSAGLQ